jgi:hypothetical protein
MSSLSNSPEGFAEILLHKSISNNVVKPFRLLFCSRGWVWVLILTGAGKYRN